MVDSGLISVGVQGLLSLLVALLIFVLKGLRDAITSTQTSVAGIQRVDSAMGADLADLRVEIARTYVTRTELRDAHKEMRADMDGHHREVLAELRHIREVLASKVDK